MGITKDQRVGGREDEGGGVGLSRRRDAWREMKSYLQTTGQFSGFLMGVSVICVGVKLRRDVAGLA
jgi:hypothetical protein